MILLLTVIVMVSVMDRKMQTVLIIMMQMIPELIVIVMELLMHRKLATVPIQIMLTLMVMV